MSTTNAAATSPNGRAPQMARIAASVRTGRGALLPGRLLLLAVVAAVVLLAGMTGDSPLTYSLVIGTIYGIAILGNNAITATLGEINLSAGAFMAIGAYTAAYTLREGWALPAVVLAVVVVSIVLGALIAIPTVRLTGLFTALATFALAYAIPDLTIALSSITGGDAGTAITPPIVGGTLIDGSSTTLLAIVVILFVALAAVSLWMFSRSVGSRLLTVGESPHAARSFGLRSTLLKIGVWTWAALLGGIAGLCYALAVGFLNPTVFTLFLSISLLAGGLVGGSRSVVGAWLGGLLVGTLPPNIQSVVPASASGIVFGVVLLLALLAGSGGLGQVLERWLVAPLMRRKGR
ncbi:branched-chain amino acid ABC transporter permease [Conexibacter arvalis]|uniref:Branched-chain amino acid transport system permease protein n=1 Tax=Conexibacter arvalis TaxID=912552 RepID=A0A840IFU1_9ACTN|nr:branched-chain amino acid ABC transporter permease [Conexibacter arvalis]MBB4663877.1 branched-chain amino acid transport system permease protein [Conexibacter arvalis]